MLSQRSVSYTTETFHFIVTYADFCATVFLVTWEFYWVIPNLEYCINDSGSSESSTVPTALHCMCYWKVTLIQ